MRNTRDLATESASYLAGGGEMGARLRAFDWSRNPLGPPEGWPQSLRSAVSILLPSRAQIILFWGPEFVTIYNDAYRPVLGLKHPWALGQPACEAWKEIWADVLRPLLEGVRATGEAFGGTDYPFVVERLGYPEETYFDISYDPVRGESGDVAGVFCIVSETTGRVIGERRLGVLRDISRVASEARDVEDAFRRLAEVLRAHPCDLPFALFYDNPESGNPHCVAATGAEGLDACAWPLAEAAAQRQELFLEGAALAPYGRLPGGAWPEPSRALGVLPIAVAGQKPLGFLVAGANPRRPFDEGCRDFLRLVASNVAAVVNAARSLAEERARAQALAELDRAKTAFFSNVSHEFRTPLTLMLGPLEEMLAGRDPTVGAESRVPLELVHRNALRLLRLVNTLLDFSRIEAGRVEASFELTDVASYTAELASVFRSAIEKAGLKLVIDCEAVTAPVYVDRDMWEKVVLNLLSNAFKFTLAGEIAVTLRQEGRTVLLSVRDTGTGIPESELPQVFERFHRVRGARGRTHEGTGIGLALVRELIVLHGGAVDVTSVYGEGSTFTVRIPIGRGHLPMDRVNAARTLGSTALGASPYVEEALRWLPEAAGIEGPASDVMIEKLPVAPDPPSRGARERVMLVDDNADMRDYLRRLLATRYEVAIAADGEEALALLRKERPQLVLTDAMMPRLDGFGLLRAIRADTALRETPVIMLSARAGEDASVEGLEAGADDYLIKPFGARELLARVRANLDMARVRREAAQREGELLSEAEDLRARLGAVLQQMPAGALIADAAGRIVFANTQASELLKHPVIYAERLEDYSGYRAVHADGRRYAPEEYALSRSVLKGEVVRNEEVEYLAGDGTRATLLVSSSPIRDRGGAIVGGIVTFVDITARKRAEMDLRESERQFRDLAELIPQLAWMAHPDGTVFWYNRRWFEYTGTTLDEMQGEGWHKLHDPAVLPQVLARWRASLASSEPFEMVFPIRGADGIFRAFLTRVVPVRDAAGRLVRWFGTNTDISAQLQAEETLRGLNELLERRVAERSAALLASESRFRLLVDGVAGYAIFMLDPGGYVTNWNTGAQRIKGYSADEIVGQHFSRFYTEEDRRDGVPQRALATAAATGKFEAEGWCVRKDGSPFWAHMVIDAIRGEEGRLIGFAKVTRDMTEKRAVEERLRQAQKMEAIGQLTGGVAHDFNNLLTVIYGNLESLLRRLPVDADGQTRRFAEAAGRGAERAAQLTQRLLAFSRRQPLEPKPVNLNRVVSEATELLQRTLGEAVAIETVRGAGLWWTQADPSQIENALLNLAVNARDAMPNGGRLTIETANTYLDEDYVADHAELVPGQYVLVAVSDTGTGMAKDVLEKAFEPFFTTKAYGEGTGLGLSQVYGFMKQSGGHAKIYSELGEGTTVKLYLPRLATGPNQGDETGETPVPTSRKGETVLVVEDDDDVRAHDVDVLSELGYRVTAAPDAATALEMLDGDPAIRLLFTDVGLPGGCNGRQLADEAQRRHPRLKVLFTTGYARNAIVHHGKLDPGVDLLMKPFTYAALGAKIRAVLDRPARTMR